MYVAGIDYSTHAIRMMGFPEGWVDGVSRTQTLKMLGNAVVPQQAELALQLLGGPR